MPPSPTTLWPTTLSPTTVYTDGSCLGNPGPGRLGLGGARRAVRQRRRARRRPTSGWRSPPPSRLCGPWADAGDAGVDVVSDSTYVVNCFRDRWWAGWHRRGWRNTQGKPVANRDLWEPLIELALDPVVPVRFHWVKGHSGDRWNDVVDQLATAAAAAGAGRSGP